jgi:hypothetical protein
VIWLHRGKRPATAHLFGSSIPVNPETSACGQEVYEIDYNGPGWYAPVSPSLHCKLCLVAEPLLERPAV